MAPEYPLKATRYFRIDEVLRLVCQSFGGALWRNIHLAWGREQSDTLMNGFDVRLFT